MPDGSVYIVRRTSAETRGEWVEMEFVLPAGCVPPPPHIHRRQVEEYEILEGHLDVVVRGESLVPARRRERLPMQVLARLARMLQAPPL